MYNLSKAGRRHGATHIQPSLKFAIKMKIEDNCANKSDCK